MPRYKLLMAFNQAGTGATETWISPDLAPEAVSVKIQTLIDSRNSILPNNVGWAGVRISQEGTRQRSKLLPPGEWFPLSKSVKVIVPTAGRLGGSTLDFEADQSRSSLLVKFTYDTDRTVGRYLFGPPDGIIRHEPESLYYPGCPGFSTKFDAYIGTLVNDNWVIKGQDRSSAFAPVTISDWVQSDSTPKNLGIVVPALPAPNWDVRDKVAITNVTLRGAIRTSYNGTYTVQSKNATLVSGSIAYYLRNTEDGDPAVVKNPGKIRKVAYTYYPVQGGYALKAVAHKRGNVLGTPRGKSKRRQLLG